jgi:hypothetical protein
MLSTVAVVAVYFEILTKDGMFFDEKSVSSRFKKTTGILTRVDIKR